mmetsp:Transcript_20195/g.37657  ORF Transcript_20195/g.37657 Transcript_20195/m.37657 type:complete len:175 (+) Transcript_20195:1150-1674(+)
MADSDDLLDSALDDFADQPPEPQRQQSIPLEEQIRQVQEEAHEEGHEPSHDQFLESLTKTLENLTAELEKNPELAREIDSLGQQVSSDGVLKASMVDLKEKLQAYIETKGSEHSPEDLSRYQQQLALYSQIVDIIDEPNNEEQVIILISQLSQYGDLPDELVPPVPSMEDCRLL